MHTWSVFQNSVTHLCSVTVASQLCSILIGKFLTPIHGAITPTSEMQESDTVFYSETSHPAHSTSTTKLLSTHNKDSGSKDSGIVHSDQDNGTSSNNTPPSDQPVIFKVSCDEE